MYLGIYIIVITRKLLYPTINNVRFEELIYTDSGSTFNFKIIYNEKLWIRINKENVTFLY